MAEMTPRPTPHEPNIARPPLGVEPREKDVQVTNAGYLPGKAVWVHRRFDMHAVGVVVAGRGTYRVNHGPVQAVRGPCVLGVYPGPMFHYGPDEGTTWQEHFVCLAGPQLRQWLHAGWLFKDGRVHALGDVSEVLSQHRQLLTALKRGAPGDVDRAAAIARRMLIEVYYARSSAAAAVSASPAVQAILDYCRAHPAEDVDFTRLARKHAISYSYLRQQIRRITGHPPAKYLTRLRCEEAQRLLGETNLSIKEIAAKVGIADPYTFSRTFRRSVGVSPRGFRRQTAPWR